MIDKFLTRREFQEILEEKKINNHTFYRQYLLLDHKIMGQNFKEVFQN